MKKLMSLVLACLMALSLCATAFAADATTSVTDLTEGATVELTSVTQGATIKIVVPTSATIGLNPYEMNVEIKDGKLVNGTQKGTQIISPVYKIENQSTLKIDVGVGVTATAEGVTLLTGTSIPTTGEDAKVKSAIVTMNYLASQPSATELTALPSGTATKLTLETGKKVESTKDVTLAVPDTASPTSSTLYFTFDGKLNGKSATPWTSDDIINATIVFTFTINTK